MATETNCRGCGVEFRKPGERSHAASDCPGCHLCYDCAWPDCPVCGDKEGVLLNAAAGVRKPDGFGAVPWPAVRP